MTVTRVVSILLHQQAIRTKEEVDERIFRPHLGLKCFSKISKSDRVPVSERAVFDHAKNPSGTAFVSSPQLVSRLGTLVKPMPLHPFVGSSGQIPKKEPGATRATRLRLALSSCQRRGVQGDAYAPPSWIRVRVPMSAAAWCHQRSGDGTWKDIRIEQKTFLCHGQLNYLIRSTQIQRVNSIRCYGSHPACIFTSPGVFFTSHGRILNFWRRVHRNAAPLAGETAGPPHQRPNRCSAGPPPSRIPCGSSQAGADWTGWVSAGLCDPDARAEHRPLRLRHARSLRSTARGRWYGLVPWDRRWKWKTGAMEDCARKLQQWKHRKTNLDHQHWHSLNQQSNTKEKQNDSSKRIHVF